MQALAEGVETPEQLGYLRSIGFDKAQGYYFGRPMKIDELFALERGIEAVNFPEWRRGESNSRPTRASHDGSTGLFPVSCRSHQVRDNPSEFLESYGSITVPDSLHGGELVFMTPPANHQHCPSFGVAATRPPVRNYLRLLLFCPTVLRVITDFPRPAPSDPPSRCRNLSPPF